MVKSKNGKQREVVQQPTPSDQDEEIMEDESEAEIVVDGDLEKDEMEEELERLVFGDSVGFREGLQDFGQEDEEGGEEQDEEDGTTGLEGLDDAQVCLPASS